MSNRAAVLIAGLAGLAVFLGREATAATGGPLSVDRVRSLAERTVSVYAPSVDPMMLRAMVEIESARDPRAVRQEVHIGDASVGLMQTLVGTAQWLWDDMGARAFPRPTFTSLLNPQTSMYFGASTISRWLQRNGLNNGTEEWLVRAYNGGPGNATRSGQTLEHWRRYQRAKARLQAHDRGEG